jgi:hypothetical protein
MGERAADHAIGRRASSSLHAVKSCCDVTVAAGDVMVVVGAVSVAGLAVSRLNRDFMNR